LVIVTQENKLVHNLPNLLHRPAKSPLLAFWGHGRNMQAPRKDSWPERFKHWTGLRVDWWFAYTRLSASFVEGSGFPSNRITVLNNSIDTATLRQQFNQAALRSHAELRAHFGLRPGPLAVFIGSLYAEKRIPFLLQAALKLRALIPGFQLAIAGAGPERAAVEHAASASGNTIHFVGAVHDEEKARLLASADIMLNPGLVGLGILDAFVAGVPIATTDCGLHSPEIAYLEHGQNGLMTANTLDSFVADVAAILNDPTALQRLGEAARSSAARYTLAAMTENFTSGIQTCMAEGRRA
jgi:glycosyltransferase involved in cell wall biosynthesis